MLFNSITFLVFLPIVFCVYWFFGSRKNLQNIILLTASYIFYGWWDYRFLGLIMASTTVDFIIGQKIYLNENTRVRKILLYTSMSFNLILLGFFKYYNFFIDSLYDSIRLIGYEINEFNSLDIILPVGISFYTFQTMSYSIDIYQRKLTPTNNFISFSTFVAFFPQLVAGPIEKAHKLLPQIENNKLFDFKEAKNAIFIIIYGLFKKVVIADNVAIIVDDFYSNPEVNSGNTSFLFLSIFLYSLQIYCDFSGYSDMAIGISRFFGIKLEDNFKRPYFSKSIISFWRRWHISLSTWFRDYVFIPLGGSKYSYSKTLRNSGVVFLTSGLWHGPNWTFVIWGIGHFLIYAWTIISNRLLKFKLNNILGGAITFISVTLLWIFFRSQNFSEAIAIIKNISQLEFMSLPIGLFTLTKLYFLISIFLLLEIGIELKEKSIKYIHQPLIILLTILLILFGNYNSNAFIYFQF